MSTQAIRFGTDGWRGRIADTYTFAAVRRCAHGFGRYLLETAGDTRPVIVGYDQRFASEHFAATAAEVLAGLGLRILMTNGATPTPAIAHAVAHHGAAGAVNITASHNPPGDNGFKVRDSSGAAISPEGLKRIEALIPETDEDVPRQPLAQAKQDGRITIFDAGPDYRAQLERLVDIESLRRAGFLVYADTMWGNGAGWFLRLLNGGSTQVVEIHNERNPIFPEMSRPEPIPPNIDAGLARARQAGASVLLITDGDADRVGLGDEHGVFVDQLRVFALLAFYLLEVRGERGPIVKTLSTTSMLEKLGRLYHVPVYETGVGFKYIAPKMLEVDALIGGEESGGYAFRGHVPERDGILAGLYLLDMMVRMEQPPSQLVETLFARVGPHFYDRIDRPLPPERRGPSEERLRSERPSTIGGLRVTDVNTLDGFKYLLEDGGWLLIRFSGTEPLVRVYTETTSEAQVQPILQDGLKLAGVE
ncbi:MAG TPA: phosphoglucomutase/phosphomannomutase family protein [Anaerolineales bacterium]|nr:phosphoglucomutase/phosphomannomutase family protein [Anaerolineales bacterium]